MPTLWLFVKCDNNKKKIYKEKKMVKRDKPRDKTLQAWKTEYSWLEIEVKFVKIGKQKF